MKNVHITLVMFLMLLSSRPLVAEDGRIRIRAREHYEQLRIDGFKSGQSADYASLSNSINIWYERPFLYAFGLTGSPLWATLPIKGTNIPDGTGDRIRLVHIGAEAKWFPRPEILPLFARLGLFRATLQSNGSLGVLRGYSTLIGVGYEWDLGGIGLAPEMAWRMGQLDRGLSFVGTAPAIGLHFYKAL